MYKTVAITTVFAGLALTSLPGCTPKAAEEQVATPQDGEAAKREMEEQMKKMQEEMQKQVPPRSRR